MNAGDQRSTSSARDDAGLHNGLDVPEVARKYALLYLLVKKKILTRQDVMALADKLYRQAPGTPKSLREVCEDAGLKNGFGQDVFVNRVSLRYDESEKTRSPSQDAARRPTKHVDVLAGEGVSRPLLKELYSLESLGLVTREGAIEDERFTPTSEGRAYAEALRVSYNSSIQKPRHQLIIINRDGVVFPDSNL